MPGALAVVLPQSPRASSHRQQVTPAAPGFTRNGALALPGLAFGDCLPPMVAAPCTTKIKRGSGGNWNATFSALESTSS